MSSLAGSSQDEQEATWNSSQAFWPDSDVSFLHHISYMAGISTASLLALTNNKARQQAHRNKKKALQTEINRLSGADPNSNFGHTLRDRSIADLEESLRQLQVAHSQNSTQIEGNGDANNQGMELDDDGAASQRAAMSPSAGSEFGIWTSFQHDLDFMLQHESTGEVAYDPDELQGWGYEDHDDPYYP
ncbi:hypothetical protein L202_04525 [Cryptococcus amylolentus CBS 6039]|uniref:Uncharacterized protein n=1 Tax=Cryptococcus amylolentus CBS 6039 TaxID=1295533 RepID=A0A1E3HRN9_9TREE|nr:hypothetical protein L202_04525 [Cryptococcus amylolentus CBS 6039]ODN79019.1 hypothetical protein L202_04525 [Cryptococcus amylolentus CBS 6039]